MAKKIFLHEAAFKEIRDEYTLWREQERRALADFLAKELGKDENANNELHVITSPRAGKGWTQYTSGKRIYKYNLSNWKWIEVTDKNCFSCVVSLNMPDIDPRSGNFHALFDRIGLLVSYHKGNHYYETAIYTDINLPLNASANESDEKKKKKLEQEEEEKKTEIAQLVLEQYKNFKRNRGEDNP